MTRFWNVFSQIILGAGQVANLVMPALSGKNQALVAGGIAAVQLAVSAVAHSKNPDGTPAKVPYVKTEKTVKIVGE